MQGEADGEALETAALGVVEELAGGLSGAPRFQLLMALSALRMAARERALAPRLARAAAAVMEAARAEDMAGVRDALRRGGSALSPGLHAALMADATLRTAVTRPAALTSAERAGVGLPDG